VYRLVTCHHGSFSSSISWCVSSRDLSPWLLLLLNFLLCSVSWPVIPVFIFIRCRHSFLRYLHDKNFPWHTIHDFYVNRKMPLPVFSPDMKKSLLLTGLFHGCQKCKLLSIGNSGTGTGNMGLRINLVVLNIMKA
jgi:hypothetical protein